MQAGLKARDAALYEVVMTDVAPYSLGIEQAMRLDDDDVVDGHFDPIIERNTVVPVSRVKTYFPHGAKSDARRAADLPGRGAHGARQHRARLAEGAAAARRRARSAASTCASPTTSTACCRSRPRWRKTGQTYGIVIEGNPGVLSEEEIQQQLKSLAELKIHPREQLENRTLLARAERFYEQLRGDEREWLGRQIMRFEQLLATQDNRRILPGQKMLREILDQLERLHLPRQRTAPVSARCRRSSPRWASTTRRGQALDERALRRAYARPPEDDRRRGGPGASRPCARRSTQALRWVAWRDAGAQVGRRSAAPEAEPVAEAPARRRPRPRAAPSADLCAARAGRGCLGRLRDFQPTGRRGLPGRDRGPRRLVRALADERLINIDTRTIFECDVARLLANGWQAGHEHLFDPAVEVFGWNSDHARLANFGQVGALLSRGHSRPRRRSRAFTRRSGRP